MQSNPLQVFNFEDQSLSFITYKGRPAVLAGELGDALGYSSNKGSELSKQIRDEWEDEFEEGYDLEVITGDALGDLREAFARGKYPRANLISPKSRSAVLLYESGVNLACSLTKKPVGKRLRRLFAREILPSLNSKGYYSVPSHQPDAIAEELSDIKARLEELEAKPSQPVTGRIKHLPTEGLIPRFHPNGQPIGYAKRINAALQRMDIQDERVDLEVFMAHLGERSDDYLAEATRIAHSSMLHSRGLLGVYKGEAHPKTWPSLKRWKDEKHRAAHPEMYPLELKERVRLWVVEHPDVQKVNPKEVCEELGFEIDPWRTDLIKSALRKFGVKAEIPPRVKKPALTVEDVVAFLETGEMWTLQEVARHFKKRPRDMGDFLRESGWLYRKVWREGKRIRAWVKPL